MTLKDWLATPASEGWTVPKLAEICEVTPASVYGWIAGTGLPLLENFAVLERISGGQIRVSSLVQVHRAVETKKALKRLGEAA